MLSAAAACLLLATAPAFSAEPEPVAASGASAADNQTSSDEAEMGETAGMAMAQGSGEHPVNWVEFVARDHARGVKFFQDVFGWEMTPFMDGYTTFMTPNGFAGGINSQQADQPLRLFTYIQVPSVDEALASAEAAGATIAVPKMVIDEASGKGIGFFVDPAGVITGVADMQMEISDSPTPFGETKPKNNSICSLELYGGDFEKTKAFYGELFGWGCAEDPAMPGFMSFNPGLGLSGVFQNHTPAAHSMVYIWVDDVKAASEKIVAAGGKMFGEPMSMPGFGTFAYFTDTEGATHGLISH
jgi:predicted enzyme related to lactoylglutathione lyase